MKTLDRYIIRQFLINFGIMLMVLMVLFVVVDLIIDLDEFIEAGQVRADRFGGSALLGTLYTIGDYYGPMLVLLYVFFSGLLVMAAMGFTFTGLQRHRELTAMVASGVSMYRIAAPVVVVGILLNALALPAQEWLIPPLANKLIRRKSEVKYDVPPAFPVHFAPDEAGNLISASDFDAVRGQLDDVRVLQRTEQGLHERRITASQAVWDPNEEHWDLTQGYATRPDMDADRLNAGDPEPVERLETELSPTVLLARRATNYPRLLPMAKLQQMQDNPAVQPSQRDQITQIIWSRFSLMVVNVLVLVMGLPFFLLRYPRNSLVQAIKAAGVCLGAWGTGLTLLQLSSGVLGPVVSAWLPVALLLPVAAVLLLRVET